MIVRGSTMKPKNKKYDKKNPTYSLKSDKDLETFMNLVSEQTDTGFANMLSLVPPTLRDMQKRRDGKRMITGLRTGFEDLDKITDGLQPSELIILSALPSMGKTSLALNIAEHVAMNEKKAVAIFSFKMSKEALMHRLLCSAARVHVNYTQRGLIDKQNWSKLSTMAIQLSEAPIYIDDSSSLNVLELGDGLLRVASELIVQDKKISLVIIDDIHAIRGGDRVESRQQGMWDILRSLKCIARRWNVPILALSELQYETLELPEFDEDRKGRPQLSDLTGESSTFKQVADVIAFLYRPEYYMRDMPKYEKTATLIIAKNRSGPTGEISLTFQREYAHFESIIYNSDVKK